MASSPRTHKSDGPSLVEEWTCLFHKFQMSAVLEGCTCRKALVVTLVQLLNFLTGANDNLEWESVAFSSTGTGMEGLSAVLSGSAVLMDDTGVLRNQVEMRGAKDLSSYLTLAISEDHNICKRKHTSRAKAKPAAWSQMKCRMQSQAAHALASVLPSSISLVIPVWRRMPLTKCGRW